MRVKYILPLILSVFAFRIFSQPPIWHFVTFSGPNGGQITLPIYTTQLVYQLNVSQNASVQFIQITIPQSILQQQLQYCKTYDPFITNNISVLQCAYAYPSIAVVYTTSGSMPNNNSYEIPYYMIVLSYDNVTGLPQTFQIYLNNRVSALSPGIYFVYVYYGGPYFFPYASMKSPNIPSCPSLSAIQYSTPSNFNGGWCGSNNGAYFPVYSNPWGQVFNTVISSYQPPGRFTTTRYLFATFNPQYPVLIGYQRASCSCVCVDSGSITVMDPSTGQTATLSISGGTLYDLRLLEQLNGLDPYQFNEIVNVNLSASYNTIGGTCTYAGSAIPGFFLIYTPQT
jgi:hypothetical protein